MTEDTLYPAIAWTVIVVTAFGLSLTLVVLLRGAIKGAKPLRE